MNSKLKLYLLQSLPSYVINGVKAMMWKYLKTEDYEDIEMLILSYIPDPMHVYFFEKCMDALQDEGHIVVYWHKAPIWNTINDFGFFESGPEYEAELLNRNYIRHWLEVLRRSHMGSARAEMYNFALDLLTVTDNRFMVFDGDIIYIEDFKLDVDNFLNGSMPNLDEETDYDGDLAEYLVRGRQDQDLVRFLQGTEPIVPEIETVTDLIQAHVFPDANADYRTFVENLVHNDELTYLEGNIPPPD